ncbi:hypothetical protein ACOJIV_27965 [Haloarcula sp. AONF1]
MNRRRLLKLGGLVAVGGTATIGAGAFNSASAQRRVEIAVADDDSGYLGLNGTTENGRVSDIGDPDKVAFAIPSAQEDTIGDGIGQNSAYEFADLLNVRNQGDDTVLVWSESTSTDPIDSISLTSSERVLDKKSDGVELNPGEHFSAGLLIEIGTAEETGEYSSSVTIRAEVPGTDNFPDSDM